MTRPHLAIGQTFFKRIGLHPDQTFKGLTKHIDELRKIIEFLHNWEKMAESKTFQLKNSPFLVLPPADGGDVENVVATDEGVAILVL